jgi:hypothetical protein
MKDIDVLKQLLKEYLNILSKPIKDKQGTYVVDELMTNYRIVKLKDGSKHIQLPTDNCLDCAVRLDGTCSGVWFDIDTNECYCELGDDDET